MYIMQSYLKNLNNMTPFIPLNVVKSNIDQEIAHLYEMP
jgi:hypothetical protein